MLKDNLCILKHYYIAKFRMRKLKSREQIEKYYDKQMEKLLKTILPKSSFYANLHKDYSLNDWRKFPIITKKEWMGHFDEINTLGIHKTEASALAIKSERTRDFTPLLHGVTVGLSSGTTGNQSVWLVSPKERLVWAGNMLAKMLPYSIFAKEKIAFFMRADSNLYDSLGSKRLKFKFFDMLDSIDKHVSRLNEYRPSILSAPPSILHMLAIEVHKGTIHINPKKIISVADVLTNDNKKFIESAFGQKVHQVYQATEGFIASTCSNGFLHLNEDLLVVQKNYVDKKSGRFEPIITDMSRVTQPIIRYKMNDILIEDPHPCVCGSPFTRIKEIEGRSDDVLYFISENKKIPIFPDFIRDAIIESDKTVDDYLVKQVSKNIVEVYLAKAPSSNLKKGLEKVFSTIPSKNIRLVFKTPVPPRSRLDKLRRVMNASNLNKS